MKAPVLVVADATHARAIRTALADAYSLTITDDVAHGRALASTGAFLAVIAVGVEDGAIDGAATVKAGTDATRIRAVVLDAAAGLAVQQRALSRRDDVGAVPYDDYIELARYAATRRYLMALLTRHGGSVTNAARGAKMKRESMHRLLRRHHLIAEDFRDHT